MRKGVLALGAALIGVVSVVGVAAPSHAAGGGTHGSVTCAQAKKAVKVAKTPAAKKKAKRAVQKACKTAAPAPSATPAKPTKGALPAGGVSWNLDGSVRYDPASPQWDIPTVNFQPAYAGLLPEVVSKKVYELSNDKDQYRYMGLKSPTWQKVVDSVSGDNWVDQSDKPIDQRVGLPPGTPKHLVDAARMDLTGSLLRKAQVTANIGPGDVITDTNVGPVTVTSKIAYTPLKGFYGEGSFYWSGVDKYGRPVMLASGIAGPTSWTTPNIPVAGELP